MQESSTERACDKLNVSFINFVKIHYTVLLTICNSKCTNKNFSTFDILGLDLKMPLQMRRLSMGNYPRFWYL